MIMRTIPAGNQAYLVSFRNRVPGEALGSLDYEKINVYNNMPTMFLS
jgi:hypothetical protein